MTLFLRWALVNSLFGVALAAAAVGYHGHVPVAGELAVGAVLTVYAAASLSAGVGAWRGTVDLRHVRKAKEACPMIALLGTVSGFLIAFGGGASTDVQHRVIGASTGLVATFVGISAALVLMLQAHLLDGKPRPLSLPFFFSSSGNATATAVVLPPTDDRDAQ